MDTIVTIVPVSLFLVMVPEICILFDYPTRQIKLRIVLIQTAIIVVDGLVEKLRCEFFY